MSLEEKLLPSTVPGRETPGFLSRAKTGLATLGTAAMLSLMPSQLYANPNNVGDSGKKEAAVPTASSNLSPQKRYEMHFSEGTKLQSERKFREAIASYTSALSAKPNDALALNERGVCQIALKNYNSSISDFKKAIEIRSTYSTAHFNLGLAQLERARQINKKNDAQELAGKALHSLYIAKDLAYAQGQTDLVNRVNFTAYHRKIQNDAELRGMDISQSKHDITRGERRDKGIDFYNAGNLAAAHYEFRQIIAENINDKLMKEAKRYEKRCRRKMARKGIAAIALYQTSNK